MKLTYRPLTTYYSLLTTCYPLLATSHFPLTSYDLRLTTNDLQSPLAYDLIGYDPSTKIVYIARTNWGNCDCATDLYKYHVARDSFEIVNSWSKRTEYPRNKTELLKAARLTNLVKPANLLSTVKNFYTFRWLPLQPDVKTRDVFDFEVIVGNNTYRYQQCFSNSTNPRIKHFRITQDVNLLLITYKGDCPQGNPVDVLILCRNTPTGWSSRII